MDIRPVDVWIRHHHEHWDGSGYPHGLAGEEIPFGSRVILVADAYDAITTERSYRAAATPRRRWPSCARMPARSSTRPSSPRWRRISRRRLIDAGELAAVPTVALRVA